MPSDRRVRSSRRALAAALVCLATPATPASAGSDLPFVAQAILQDVNGTPSGSVRIYGRPSRSEGDMGEMETWTRITGYNANTAYGDIHVGDACGPSTFADPAPKTLGEPLASPHLFSFHDGWVDDPLAGAPEDRVLVAQMVHGAFDHAAFDRRKRRIMIVRTDLGTVLCGRVEVEPRP